ncbi:MAG TPA: hypothetical protein PK020_19705 [Ilumatobacteraceae bacterium]|nr:hypothetical protein [Ilumatobacteraceae bacterium]
MTSNTPTAQEFTAICAPARFRTSTFNSVIATLPDLEPALADTFAPQHRAAVDRIAEADLALVVEVHLLSEEAVQRSEWFAGPRSIVECCHGYEQVLTTTWPADDGVLTIRLALAIGFRENVVAGWVIDEAADRPRVRLSPTALEALRDGNVTSEMRPALGSVQSVIRMWSASADTAGTQLAYDSTIVHTATGPWLLERGDEPCLRRIHPVELWGELAMVMNGFEDVEIAEDPT